MATETPKFDTIFCAAIEIASAEDRAAYLARVCGDDLELRGRWKSWWPPICAPAAFSNPRPLISPLPKSGRGVGGEGVAATVDQPAVTEAPGARIGPYKLLQKLGEGGMGTVWMAEQEHPVKRRVALKVIQAGMDSRQVLARFEQERQALAMMDHPNIAKVLDAGTIDVARDSVAGEPPRSGGLLFGRPYFVMELVKGISITKFCDQEHLTPKERLELFIPVCQAVQHAHQKGIIHRDIKPSNVLVAFYDGRPVPKVIDFGVAKATSQKLTERTLFTDVGSIVGTLEYMAPEQAELNNLDIDTRADIYSLGVLLYELLTGSPPFTSKQLRSAAFTEMLRIIREVEPPKPSTKLSSSEELPSIAANRKLEPKKLTKLVHGELDWIVMKCLEKERSRRYETANALALEIQRYLHDEPVVAGPPSVGYRLRKFARRNQGPVLAVSLIFAVLVCGIMGTTLGLLWALAAEQRASDRLVEVQHANVKTTQALQEVRAANAQTTQALADTKLAKGNTEKALADTKQAKADTEKALADSEQARQHAEAVSKFLVEAFRRPDPALDGRELKVVDLLDGAAKKLDTEFAGSPKIKGHLLDALGETYQGLGLPAKAVEMHEKARAVRQSALGPDHPDTLVSMNGLASAYLAAGRRAEALPLFEETLKLKKAKLGLDHPSTLISMDNLAGAYWVVGRRAEALPLYEETLKLMKAKLGPDHPSTLTSMNNLAGAYEHAGRLAEALPLYEETLKLMKAKLGPDHPETLKSMGNLAGAYRAAGRRAEALPLYEETLKLMKAKLGPEHPITLTIMNNLASAYRDAGQHDKALPLFEETLKLMKAKLGLEHHETLTSMTNLAGGYLAAGQLDKALPLFEETLQLKKAKLGPHHPLTLTCMGNLALAYREAGQLDKALPLFEETLKLQKAKLGSDHPETLRTMNNLAGGYQNQGDYARAESLFLELVTRRKKQLGAEHPDVAGALASLGLNYLKQKKYADAEPHLRESLAIRAKKLPDDWLTFNAQSMLGGSLLGQQKYAAAEPLLLQGYEGMKAREKTIPANGKIRVTEALERLVQFYDAWGKKDQADEWRKKLEAHKEAEKKN